MTTREWRQVTVTFPDPHTAEQTARSHLAPILAEAERQQLITAWFYIRKQGWRVRFAPATHDADRYVVNELERLARDRHLHTIIPGSYEPEVHAFGGTEPMQAAHQLWHHDSRHLLLNNDGTAARQRETSIMLSAAMMRAAKLDWYEQGDVWARIAEHRDRPATGATSALLNGAKRLLTVDPASLTRQEGSLAGYQTLIEAYAAAGESLRHLNDTGQLHRGLRDVLTHHVIFSWNRRGIPGPQQAALATAAATVIFGPDPTLDILAPDGTS
ncbi:thiopeptide-type bacteriocin biosynthesis protein [Catenuloplanes nepalensis]|uniref:Thiopeptide-type bacteriocin biosynthesis protein n=1 Tax=Catenuloplanes nepalensis TaxID=587533 RepID=A0ABT9MM91_9ACTN|nr:thiopeptide-type bacteriocin biosynthesis protein [Catenuloplanes nepalensis]MDP9792520.1 thiopeptide-type bacteriocin biosynthesis protein [Catenuloplanes nepalensis]